MTPCVHRTQRTVVAELIFFLCCRKNVLHMSLPPEHSSYGVNNVLKHTRIRNAR